MAGRIPARLSASEGRRFAFTLAAAFGVVGGVLYLRGARTACVAALLLAGLMLAAGVAVPAKLGPVEAAWMKFGELISKVTTPVFMGIIYFVVMMPIALFRRMLGKDGLTNRAAHPAAVPGGYWLERPKGKRASDLRRQF